MEKLSGYLFVLFWFCFYLPVSFPDIYFHLFLSLRCSDVILKGGEVGKRSLLFVQFYRDDFYFWCIVRGSYTVQSDYNQNL